MNINENHKKWKDNHGKNVGCTYKITCTWAVNKHRTLKWYQINDKVSYISLKCDIRKNDFQFHISMKTYAIERKKKEKD